MRKICTLGVLLTLMAGSVGAQQTNTPATGSLPAPPATNVQSSEADETTTQPQGDAPPATLLERRMQLEATSADNPFVITQYRMNYILPFSYISDPNPIGYEQFSDQGLDNWEAKYQISVKMPLYMTDERGSGVYFGFTAKSFWQVYNSEISKPFRETNYEPELFYAWNTRFRILGRQATSMQIGLNHQSNGQSQGRSRSWNRLFASVLMSDEHAYYYLRAWHRFSEEVKTDPLSPEGDDNPDITHYLGHMELGVGTRLGRVEMLALLRNNFSRHDNKGAIELNFTYPISNRYSVLLQYFNGYGDSLIDYNRHQQRIGLGIQLSIL